MYTINICEHLVTSLSYKNGSILFIKDSPNVATTIIFKHIFLQPNDEFKEIARAKINRFFYKVNPRDEL